MPAERLLLGLIDNTHAAASQLAEDAEVANPLKGRPPAPDTHPAGGGHGIGLRLHVLDEEERREELGELLATFGGTRQELADGGLLPAAPLVDRAATIYALAPNGPPVPVELCERDAPSIAAASARFGEIDCKAAR